MKLHLFIIISLLVLSACNASSCSTIIAGVKRDNGIYSGIMANLTVELSPGTGRVFVDTMPLTQVDTQASARLAKEVSCELLNIDCNSYDFFYIIRSEHPMVGGPSAGASMAVCTLSLLANLTLFDDALITGTINPDGSIGAVGSVFEKLQAFAGYGFNYFLAPQGSEIEHALINNSLVQINLTEYAPSIGLIFVPVEDVFEALAYMTGSTIQLINVTSADLVSAEYEEVMLGMSYSLYDEALLSYESVNESKLNELLNESYVLLNQSFNYINEGFYYSSASYSVRSMIFSVYIKHLDSFNDSSDYVSSVINDVESLINNFSDSFHDSLIIDNIYDIECISITIDRIREAHTLIVQSRDAFNYQEYARALYLASYAYVRYLTAFYWSTLIDYFSGGEPVVFDQAVIKPLVIERLEQARNSIAYARTMVSNSLLSSEEHLINAVKEFNNGNYIYALFEALESRAEANLAMEIRALSNLSLKVDSKTRAASRAIKRAMERGLLPLLSLSFLEYSQSFGDIPLQQLIFLSYSEEFAGISALINDYVQYDSLRDGDGFVITPFLRPKHDVAPLYQILLILIGFAFALILTLVRYEY